MTWKEKYSWGIGPKEPWITKAGVQVHRGWGAHGQEEGGKGEGGGRGGKERLD